MALWISYLIAGIGGALLGVFHFGGLWYTIKHVHHTRNPGVRICASSLARAIITVWGFYWIMHGRWERLVAAVVGFVIARHLMVRQARRKAHESVTPTTTADAPTYEDSHYTSIR